MNRRILSVLAVLVLAAPSWAVDGHILLQFSPDVNGPCDMDIPCFCKGTLYVTASLIGASAAGITGAEYKIAVGPNNNADPGWIATETFEPGALVIGTGAMSPADPFARGVNVAWATCQQGDGTRVLIQRIEILRIDCSPLLPTLQLQVVKRDQPSNPFFQCPLFTLCDAPTYTKVCLGTPVTCQNPEPPFANDALCSTSSEARVNSPIPCCLSCPRAVADCSIAVESESWSRVKGLYRN